MDNIYPIGSIFISTNTINPNTYFGGPWERIKVKLLLAAYDSSYKIGSTGGEATHKLNMKELPGNLVGASTNNRQWATGAWNNYSSYAYVYTTINDTHNTQTNGDSDQPHNNMPPYLVVYIWKRIA